MSLLTQDLIDRVERLTGRPAHPFLRRGIFFAHRDLHEILDCHERGEPFYLYTGRVRLPYPLPPPPRATRSRDPISLAGPPADAPS